MKLNKEEQYALKVTQAIGEYFTDEGNGGKLNTNELTEFFTGSIMALRGLYSRLTSDEPDLIDFISIMNRLVFQYLNANGKVEVEDDDFGSEENE